ncbi:hypothetical protein JTE90_004449 [Oedothorax gibbosus]|uniref:Uncharacterized protein n=1 Tax=Oedothorax gibbosus TaxID=931172 RepID=A0AAV6UPC2_9ARAC|nr:hypothetical protein JTE90_004449 [Oedothorax gibbosus]
MQPADVSVFKPLKSGWKKTVRDWLSQPQNINSVLTKSTFCPLLSTLLQENALPQTIKNGFRKCGLYPFDPSAVDYSKCLQNAIENLPVNQTKVCTDKFPSTYYEIAEKVIQSIAPNLSSKDINSDAVIEEIRKAKSAQSPLTVPGMNEENDAEEIELSVNTALAIEPGVYEVDANGILTATNIIEVEESLPGPSGISNFVEDASEIDYQDNINGDISLVTKQSQSSEDFQRYQHTVSPVVDNHLFYPKPIESKKKRTTEKAPSAISSANWRKFITDKENEKQKKKLAIAKRKEERQQRKKAIELKKKTERKKMKSRSQPRESDGQEDTSDNHDDDIKKTRMLHSVRYSFRKR